MKKLNATRMFFSIVTSNVTDNGRFMRMCSYQLGTIMALILAATVSVVSADTLTILHVNDTHSYLSSSGSRNDSLHGAIGGIARAATAIGMIRASEPNVLTLHAGDVFVGDLTFNVYFGVPELRLMNMLGFDAMTLGNHEFDLTPEVLTTALDTAFIQGGFPILSANLTLNAPELSGLRSHVKPYTIKEIGNIRVGIFGLTTPQTNMLSLPGPAKIEDDLAGIARGMVDTLKAKGCKVIILLSHLGLQDDKAVAEAVSGIHAIIGGHDHLPLTSPLSIKNSAGWTTWITQADAHYHYLGKLQLLVEDQNVKLIGSQLIELNESVPEEPMVKAVVDELNAGVEAVYGPVYSQPVATVEQELFEVADNLTTVGDKDTPIGNLVTDALRSVAQTDIAIEPGGSTATGLFPGPVVPADLFRVVGYGFNTVNGLGFRVVKMKMTGAGIIAGLEFGLSTIEQHDEYLIQVSGMKYTYDPTLPVGSRVTRATVNDLPLDLSRTYSVTMNEFAIGFINFLQIPVTEVRLFDSLSEFQMLAAYVMGHQPINSPVTGRIRAELGSSSVEDSAPGAAFTVINHPNPFTRTMAISIDLPAAMTARVEIVDLLGRPIAILHDGSLTKGSHEIEFNGENLSPGVYLCRITANGESRVTQLIKR